MFKEACTRREMLKVGAVLGAGVLLPGSPGSAAAETGASRTLRIAHLSDSHTQPERRAGEGLVACLHRAQQLRPRVELVITGGDLIMDSFEADQDRTKLQWDLFTSIFKAECGLPVEHTLGNHDIWGWDQEKSKSLGNEPQYGKKWAMDVLGLSKPYKSFNRGGWHFVILDSVVRDGNFYLGCMDDEQLDWLRADLAKSDNTPTIMITHIPILAACVLNDRKKEAQTAREFKVPGSWMMVDSAKIREVFRAHPNVKLCLSGHIHQQDRVDFEGVTYICDGAVSGAWWKGPNDHCHEGFGVVDLHADGTWSHQYQTFGWKAERG